MKTPSYFLLIIFYLTIGFQSVSAQQHPNPKYDSLGSRAISNDQRKLLYFENKLDSGMIAYHEANYKKAYDLLKTSRKDGLFSGAVWYYLGMSLTKMNKPEKAKGFLLKGFTEYQCEPCQKEYEKLFPSATQTDVLKGNGSLKPSALYSINIQDRYRKKPKTFNWTVSTPVVNFYSFKVNDRRETYAGFGLVSGGLEYFITTKQFVALTASASTNNLMPIVGTDLDPRDEMMLYYIDLTHNFKPFRTSFGYGINYSGTKLISDNRERPVIEQKRQGMGLTLNAYYQVLQPMFIGIIYRSTIFRTNPDPEFVFDSFVTLDIRFAFGKMMRD